MHWRRKWQPTPVFLPGESQGRWAAVYEVAQSWTWLKRLSSSSSRNLWSEKAMAPHSSTLAWKIPWTEEPGRLQSMGSLRVWHDWATSLSLFTFLHWRRKWQPTPVFLPGESQGRWAAVYRVAQSQTRLKRLSSSSSCMRAKGSNMGTLYYLLIFICKYKTVLKNKAYGKKKNPQH